MSYRVSDKCVFHRNLADNKRRSTDNYCGASPFERPADFHIAAPQPDLGDLGLTATNERLVTAIVQ